MANNKKEGIAYMKKLLAMLLAVMLTVSCFSGCVNEPTTPGTQPTIKPTEPTTPTTQPTEPADPWAEYTITTIAGFEGIFCGASAIYSAMGQIVNAEYGKTIIPLG